MSIINGKAIIAGGGANKYIIQVEIDSGSSVTGNCDGENVTFSEVSTGVYRATVTKTGVWTITATKTGAVASTTMEIKSAFSSILAYKAGAFTSAQSGVQYIETLPDDWDIMKEIGQAISDASGSITDNTTGSIYINKGNMWAYKITPGDTITVNGYLYAVMGFNNYQLTNAANYGGNNTYAGLTLGTVDCCGEYLMDNTSTSGSGWGKCKMRTSYMETLKAGMPSTMAQIRIPYCQSTGDTVFYSDDYMFLPATKEVFGTQGLAPVGEASALTQYAYYKNGGSKVKHNPSGNAAWWWLRSHRAGFSSYCVVRDYGKEDSSSATSFYGAAPCFCV